MNEKILIGFAGRICSGKGSAGVFLEQKYGAGRVSFSLPLRKAVRIFGIEETRENIQKMSGLLRDAFGQNALEQGVCNAIDALPNDIVVLENIRRIEDVDLLRQRNYFFLIAIVADEKARYEWYCERNESEGDRAMTWGEFCVRDNYETEKSIDGLSDYALEVVNNSGSLSDFEESLDRVVSNIIKKKKQPREDESR